VPQVNTAALDEMKSYFKTKINKLKAAQAVTGPTIQMV
jgi:hypothetical protein